MPTAAVTPPSRRRWNWRHTIGLVAIVIVLFYAMSIISEHVAFRARGAKAQADVRSIASAVSMYKAHTGVLPKSLADLVNTTMNAKGETSQPFLTRIPTPPPGWSDGYQYISSADGAFTVSAAGDGIIVRAP